LEKKCPTCGMDYKDFRTGLTFAEVKADMFVESEDSADWVYKRRRCVLRRWNKIKISMWKYHIEECKVIENENTSSENISNDVLDY
jgi:hypothetical protein